MNNDFNNTASPYPSDRTIVDLFVEQVRSTPHAEAVRFRDASLTYAQLNGRANQFARHLQSNGVGPGDFVVLHMEHSIDVVCAILGALKAGAAYVPVDPSVPKERLAFIVRETAAASVVTDLPPVGNYSTADVRSPAGPQDLAYVIFTSGSTGEPKGVMIEHRSLVNYIWWARRMYSAGESLTWPLFSSLAFDLTVTSIFTPLISGGRIVVYREDPAMKGMVIADVIADNAADIVKLTPAHISMIRDLDLRSSRIRKFIVGGEDFKVTLARDLTRAFPRPIEIYNEYGPTEATVGCMIHRFDIDRDQGLSVPIGTPAANAAVYVIDGEMHLAGDGLARGYFKRPELTAEKFVVVDGIRLYKSGDLARWTDEGRIEFLGRRDHQVKIGSARIELGEIEARLLQQPEIRDCVVDVVRSASAAIAYCTRCGLASNMPGTTFDESGVCNLCRAYETYAEKAEAYFKTPDELKLIVAEMKANRAGDYDCIVMLSGGKDSTYMLYQLCALGLKPLAFTLENGFISTEAKDNIDRVVKALGVDHVYAATPHMNAIFVDSLQRFANVCNGCFKTLYTLATNLAQEKKIGYVVTGLSRGQFFETRLTADVFQRDDFHADKLDALILEARKAYHHRQDAVASYLDVDVFRDEGIFSQIQFIDFYRYWSVPLAEMHDFLRTRTPWRRPSDTGRSTNCLINDLGIYVHKKQRGFHNYSLPYSWDVRLGQKTRDEAMAELDDAIDETRVKALASEIGFAMPNGETSSVERLTAWYTSDKPLSPADIRAELAEYLPDYMIPARFIRLERLPLTSNGKVDRKNLPAEDPKPAREVLKPRTDTERVLTTIWSQLLNVQIIGIHDDFFELGAQSLVAIRAVSRIRDAFGVDVSLRNLFEKPTVAGLAEIIDANGRSYAGDREEIAL